MKINNVWEDYPEEIDEIIGYMARDKVTMASYRGLYIIDVAAKEAIRVKNSKKEFLVIHSPYGEYITVAQNVMKMLEAA